MLRRLVVPLVLALALALALGGVGGGVAGATRAEVGPLDARNSVRPASTAVDKSADPLAGRVVVVDPGHQLGNHHFPEEIDRPVPAGGFTKPCNTTGTATDGGYPEATFAWQVSRLVAKRLRALGATVRMTRHSNREDRWGPCVDVRGRAGNAIGADLKVSVHADGSYAPGAHGFHVIVPPDRAPWTDDVAAPSMRLAGALKAGLLARRFTVATYVAGGDGLDVRADLGTLNLSDVPVAMVELGNMRSAAEARVMTSPRGRTRYARALVSGIRAFLD